VAERIETPFPSMDEVAKTLGVPPDRVKEIERLVEERSKTDPRGRTVNRRSGSRPKRESTRIGRRS